MKSSNLALRMEPAEFADQPSTTPQAEAEIPGRATLRPRPRYDLRAFERRTIVIRDQGLPAFRVR
jgi:hypothetical protein